MARLRLAREWPRQFPWEIYESEESRRIWFTLDVWGEVEKILYGHMGGPDRRPDRERERIRRIVDRLEAAPDGPVAFREWLAAGAPG